MGNYLPSPVTEKKTIEGGGNGVTYVSSCVQGWRLNMEDAEIIEPQIEPGISLFGIFDGHGGDEMAVYSERHFVEELKKNINFSKKNYQVALKETCFQLDRMVMTPEGQKEFRAIEEIEYEEKDEPRTNSGCTANLCLIVDKEIICANVGDSRAVLCNAQGKPVPLSKDHKPQDPIETARVIAAGGQIYDGRVNGNLNLSRTLGDHGFKKGQEGETDPEKYMITACPDFQVHKISPDDKFLLMGCDGLWETKSDQQIVAFVDEKLQQNVPMKDIAESLLDWVMAKDTKSGRGTDNISLIIVLFKD